MQLQSGHIEHTNNDSGEDTGAVEKAMNGGDSGTSAMNVREIGVSSDESQSKKSTKSSCRYSAWNWPLGNSERTQSLCDQRRVCATRTVNGSKE